MFIIVLGKHVSKLTESSSGPSKKRDPYLKCLKMRCGIPNAYILDKTRPVKWPFSVWFLRAQEYKCNYNVSEPLHSIKIFQFLVKT